MRPRLHTYVPRKPEKKKKKSEYSHEKWRDVCWRQMIRLECGTSETTVTIRANRCLTLILLNTEAGSHKRAIVETVNWLPGNRACSFIQWKSCWTWQTGGGLTHLLQDPQDLLSLPPLRIHLATVTSPHVASGKESLSSSGPNKGRMVLGWERACFS